MKKLILILLAICLNACTENEKDCGSLSPKSFIHYEPHYKYTLKKQNNTKTTVVINSQKVIDSLFSYSISSKIDLQKVSNSHSTQSTSIIYCEILIPDFDLNTFTYLAVFAGVKPSSGYHVKINAIRENDCEMVVEYYENSPKPDEVVTLDSTYPVDYAIIPKTSKRVIFKQVDYIAE